VLKEDTTCKALFLPWHQYYSLKFNNDILTGNTSPAYFNCEIVAGKNMELGSIESQGGHGEVYDAIERVVTDNAMESAVAIGYLRDQGVKYIIFTDDVQDEDQFFYPFLASSLLTLIFEDGGLYLYKLN
jgi:hypothetical protein